MIRTSIELGIEVYAWRNMFDVTESVSSEIARLNKQHLQTRCKNGELFCKTLYRSYIYENLR